MNHEAQIDVEIDANLKSEAEAILMELGIEADQAITMLYSEIVRQQGIPAELTTVSEHGWSI